MTDEQPEESLQSSDNEGGSSLGTQKSAGELIAKHYEIIGEAGCGNVSRVYRAKHLLINKIVAIKLLHQHNLNKASTVMRFQREATIVALLDHPNVVKFYEFGVHSTEQPYLILEFVEGKTLAKIVAEDGPLEPLRACRLFLQVLDAIEHLHENDILHRDIKPDNIMLNVKDVVKLVDFGFAGKHHRDEQDQLLTKGGEIFGTPNYMSPEQQVGKELDERSDIYSLSALLFFLLTGRAPFQAQSTLTTLMQHASEAPPSVASRITEPGLAKKLDALIAHGLAKEAEQRIHSIDQFRSELTNILGYVPPSIKRTSTFASIKTSPQPASQAVSEPKAGVSKLVVGALAFAVVVGGFFYYDSMSKAEMERGETAAKAKAEANRPQTRDEMTALWKHLDMKGQTQFNVGQYAQSEKTFREALRLGMQIDPKGVQVQNSLEELIDLRTAQNKEVEPAWREQLKAISSVELKLQQKESLQLREEISRLAKASTGGTKAETMKVRAIVAESIDCSQHLSLLGDNAGALELLNSLDALGKTFPKMQRSRDAVVKFLKTEETVAGTNVDIVQDARESLAKLERDIAVIKQGKNFDRRILSHRYYAAAVMARRARDYGKAMLYAKESTEATLTAEGPASLLYGDALVSEAWLYEELGQRGKAQQKALSALKVFKGPSGTENLNPVYQNRVADIYSFLGNYEMASSTLTESLAVQQKAEYKNYRSISDCLIQIAHINLQMKRPTGLTPLVKRALAIRQRLSPETAMVAANPTRMLGDIAFLEGRKAEAEGFYKAALAICLADKRDASPSSAVQVYSALGKLYSTYGTKGGDDKAIDAYRQQIAIMLKTYGSRAVMTIPVQFEIARIYEKRGEYEKADNALLEAQKLLEKSDRSTASRSFARVLMQRAKVLEEMGNSSEASKLREKAMKQ